MGQPDGADGSLFVINVRYLSNNFIWTFFTAGSLAKDETYKENGYIEVKSSILMSNIGRHNSTPALYQPNSAPRDTQSLIGSAAPYRSTNER